MSVDRNVILRVLWIQVNDHTNIQFIQLILMLTQSAEAVEYTDCISEKE